MRIRTAIGIMICCCAGLAGCTAAAPQGPATTVTTPHAGKPPPPVSVDAALAHAPLTPYVLLGIASNDGLAPGESPSALASACMTAAGFLNAGGNVPRTVRLDSGLGVSMSWGECGYLGVAQAEQSGFQPVPGAVAAELGTSLGPGADPSSFPQAEQDALGKCGTIVGNFTGAQQSGPLAVVQALANDVGTDVQHDPAVRSATKAWSACMSRNGYSYTDPAAVSQAARQLMYSGNHGGISSGTPVSASANQSQLAMATADASCTQSTDLAGIYFAVQASYEQQLVSANQQALTAAVRRYRAAYKKALDELPALLRTAKAIPFPPAKHKP